MKIKQTFYLIVIVLITNTIKAQDSKYLYENYDYKPKEKVYLFGDNVKLRAEPNTESEVIDVLRIGTEITIIKKTEKTLTYQGSDSAWYKVKYKNKTGYVIDGLMALDKKIIKNTSYLILLKKETIVVRVLNGTKKYIEKELPINISRGFTTKIYNDKGLGEIKNMLYIDFMAEACGEDGGGIYIFNDGENIDTITISSVGDGGIYWFDEKLIFPEDKEGKKGRIIYKMESGEVIEEETNWVKSKKVTRELQWIDGEIQPKIRVNK